MICKGVYSASRPNDRVATNPQRSKMSHPGRAAWAAIINMLTVHIYKMVYTIKEVVECIVCCFFCVVAIIIVAVVG